MAQLTSLVTSLNKSTSNDSRGLGKTSGSGSLCAAAGGKGSLEERTVTVFSTLTNALARASVLEACMKCTAPSAFASTVMEATHPTVGDFPPELATWTAYDLRSALLVFQTRIAQLLPMGGDALSQFLDAWQKVFQCAQSEGHTVTVDRLREAIMESKMYTLRASDGGRGGPIRGRGGRGDGGRGRSSPYGGPSFGRGRGSREGQVCYNSMNYGFCRTVNCPYQHCVGPTGPGGTAPALALPSATARR
jgi:hypothetical protein